MAKITALENGPLLVEGTGTYVVVKDGQEERLERKSIALCRCGGSSNKPFCDGTHKKIEFQAGAAEVQVN